MQDDVFLQKPVGRHARRANVSALWLAIQTCRFPIANNMDGCIAAIDGAVRYRVVLAIEFDALGLVFELVAEQAEQRHNPLLASFSGRRRFRFQTIEFSVEDAPVVLRIGPGTGNLVLDLRAGIETEIGRALTGGLFQPLEDVWRVAPSMRMLG